MESNLHPTSMAPGGLRDVVALCPQAGFGLRPLQITIAGALRGPEREREKVILMSVKASLPMAT